MRGLYAIVDTDTLARAGQDVSEFAHAVIASRPAAVQLRAKSLASRDLLALARELSQSARDQDVLFFLNDRADLALLAGSHGVHVGQADLSVEQVRRIAPSLRIGVSTHDVAQLAAALEQRPDYVAVGPIFPTLSKAAPDPVVGLAALGDATARARAAGVAVVAIGGIELQHAAEIAALGVAGAVISALGTDAARVTDIARELHAAFGGAP